MAKYCRKDEIERIISLFASKFGYMASAEADFWRKTLERFGSTERNEIHRQNMDETLKDIMKENKAIVEEDNGYLADPKKEQK